MALRIVQPDEKAPTKPEPASTSAPTTVASIASAVAAYQKRVGELDATVPINAVYLACVGATIADQALSIYHQAVAQAAPGTFRKDVPPGMKSAEATRSWMLTHIDPLKKGASDADAASKPYARAKDLIQAAQFSGAELTRAVDAASVAGLNFASRAEDMLTTAVKRLDEVSSYKPAKRDVISVDSDYIIGTDALIACHQG
jgi:hypothetical protein